MWSTIKKFGLQHCDLPTMIWNVAVMLRALTLNVDKRNKNPISWVIYLISFVIASSYFYVYLVSTAWFVFVWCRENTDLLSAVVVFSLGVSSEIGTVKLAFMFLHINKVRKLVTETLECNDSVVSGSRFSKSLMITLRKVKQRAMIFWIVIISNGIVYVLRPLLQPGRHLMEDKFTRFYGLESILESPVYEIAFFINIGAVIHTCYVPANITAFLIIIIGYIEAQMLALGEDLEGLWHEAEEHYYKINPLNISDENESYQLTKNKTINEFIAARLKFIIKTHAINISILQQVKAVFSGAIAVEFILLIVGAIAELLGGLENTYMELPFAMMQVGMDCFTGQRVIDASTSFEVAIYNCKWENYDVSNMKTILIILVNAQKTMKLSAGGVIILSFNCLMQVQRSVYSAYTTLRTIMK